MIAPQTRYIQAEQWFNNMHGAAELIGKLAKWFWDAQATLINHKVMYKEMMAHKQQRCEKTVLEVGARISFHEQRKEERKKRKQAEREGEKQSKNQKPSAKGGSAGTRDVAPSQLQPSRATPTQIASRKSSSCQIAVKPSVSQISILPRPAHTQSVSQTSKTSNQQVSPLNQYARRATVVKGYCPCMD